MVADGLSDPSSFVNCVWVVVVIPITTARQAFRKLGCRLVCFSSSSRCGFVVYRLWVVCRLWIVYRFWGVYTLAMGFG